MNALNCSWILAVMSTHKRMYVRSSHLLLESESFKNVLTVVASCVQRNMSALHYVAQRGHDREAGLLLEAGINVDAVNNVSVEQCAFTHHPNQSVQVFQALPWSRVYQRST